MKKGTTNTVYLIWVSGHIDVSWSDWFDDLRIEHQVSGRSLVTAELPDQAALMALLQRLHSLGVTITKMATQDNS